ncbi:MAG: hypothetical protein N3F66_03635 [Spirochaetes bacterium]|nr:hypothetical protein [Spirochaetota bacterium]
MESYWERIEAIDNIKEGTILLRINSLSDKQQQGIFSSYCDGGIILKNVIDYKNHSFIAIEGIIYPTKDDIFYQSRSSFANSPVSNKALKIVYDWPLYKNHPELSIQIEQFVKNTFVPEQIIDYYKNDNLKAIFVPIQQFFRIGRYKERRNIERVCHDKFKFWLDSLRPGEHITYLASVAGIASHRPKFYSAGTKPHEVTHHYLEQEEYAFNPTHGGHIKCNAIVDGKKQFLVDAGSNYIGRGVKATLFTAKQVATALKHLYPEYEFIPLPGRGAFGVEQSY